MNINPLDVVPDELKIQIIGSRKKVDEQWIPINYQNPMMTEYETQRTHPALEVVEENFDESKEKELSVPTIQKLFWEKYGNKTQLHWVKKGNAQCTTCFTLENNIRNLKEEIKADNVQAKRNALAEEEKKLQQHLQMVTESLLSCNAMQEQFERDPSAILILFDYKTPFCIPFGEDLTQTEFISRGKKSVNCLGIIIKFTVDGVMQTRKHAILYEKQFGGEGWEYIQQNVERLLSLYVKNWMKVIFIRADRCGGQNINKYNIAWMNCLCLRYGIQTVYWATGPAGHNKFEVDGMLGNCHTKAKKAPDAIKTTQALRDCIANIKSKKQTTLWFCDVIRGSYKDTKKFYSNVFSSMPGIKKMHLMVITLSDATVKEARELVEKNGLPSSSLSPDYFELQVPESTQAREETRVLHNFVLNQASGQSNISTSSSENILENVIAQLPQSSNETTVLSQVSVPESTSTRRISNANGIGLIQTVIIQTRTNQVNNSILPPVVRNSYERKRNEDCSVFFYKNNILEKDYSRCIKRKREEIEDDIKKLKRDLRASQATLQNSNVDNMEDEEKKGEEKFLSLQESNLFSAKKRRKLMVPMMKEPDDRFSIFSLFSTLASAKLFRTNELTMKKTPKFCLQQAFKDTIVPFPQRYACLKEMVLMIPYVAGERDASDDIDPNTPKERLMQKAKELIREKCLEWFPQYPPII